MLNDIIQIKNELINLVLENESYEKLLEKAAIEIGHPILLCNKYFDVVSKSDSDIILPSGFFKTTNYYKDYFQKKDILSGYYKYKENYLYIQPVLTHDNCRGFLVFVINEENYLNLSADDLELITYMAKCCALQSLIIINNYNLLNQEELRFFNKIITEEVDQQSKDYALKVYLNPENYFMVCIVKTKITGLDKDIKSQQLINQYYSKIGKTMDNYFIHGITFPNDTDIFIIINRDENNKNDKIINKFFHDILAIDKDLTIVCGNNYLGLNHFKQSYIEAQTCLEAIVIKKYWDLITFVESEITTRMNTGGFGFKLGERQNLKQT